MKMFICSTYFNGVFSLLSRFPFKPGTGDIDFFATLLVTENSVAMKIKEKNVKERFLILIACMKEKP